MTAFLLALGAALAYGISDFTAGITSRRATAWAVALSCQLASCAVVGLVALAVPALAGAPGRADWAWGLLAAVGNTLGTVCLYRGFATGRMSVVAPISAVGAALVPVAAGLAFGERPSGLVWLGIAAALPGIWLVSRVEDATPQDAPVAAVGDGATFGDVAGGAPFAAVGEGATLGGAAGGDITARSAPEVGAAAAGGPRAARQAEALRDAILAGVGFGVLFVALGQIPREAGLAPVALSQAVAVVLLVTTATATRAAWRPGRAAAIGGGLAGGLSAGASLAYLFATHSGPMTVAAILTSLYPAVTILLAAGVLREHIDRLQAGGLLLCGVAVACVAMG